MEKRKQAAEEAKLNRERAKEAASAADENTDVLDNLLEKLRNGDNIGRKARRARPSAASRPAAPLDLSAGALGNDTADLARDMLARLKSDGFDAGLPPTSPTSSTAPPRRSRRRVRGISEDLDLSPTGQLGDMPIEGQEASLDSLVEMEAPADSEPDTPDPSGSPPAPPDGGEEKPADGEEAVAEAPSEAPEA